MDPRAPVRLGNIILSCIIFQKLQKHFWTFAHVLISASPCPPAVCTQFENSSEQHEIDEDNNDINVHGKGGSESTLKRDFI